MIAVPSAYRLLCMSTIKHGSSTTSRVPSFTTLLCISVLLRVALIKYSEWHDARSTVKYTDVDYRVFSDAAKSVYAPLEGAFAQGPWGSAFSIGDPYTRETYRYTPLLAFLVTPNHWLHPSFGKYLFAACDILNGFLIHRLLLSKILPRIYDTPKPELATVFSAAHLLNPLVFSISTRGSAESILATFVLGTLYTAMDGRWDWAAVMLGLSVHWKIYPFIYGVACVSVLSNAPTSASLPAQILSMFNWRSARFFGISVMSFLSLGAGCYLIWGYPFLYETYLYHLHRLDHRHNFSPFFYLIYLTYPDPARGIEAVSLWRAVLRSPLISFFPQMILTVLQGLLFARKIKDLPFAWLAQTIVFVVFNKVCTSQYFLWYMLFLPLVLPTLSATSGRQLFWLALWIGSQALWLGEAYQLEFLGGEVFRGVWARGLVYVGSHTWVLGQLIEGYNG